jgi:thiamine biosynthesis lipoprotein
MTFAMSETVIHVFRHHAMATHFECRIAGEDQSYAEQAARTTFDLVNRLEGLLSRFIENSEISQIAQLAPGEKLRLSEPTFACLSIARKMERVTHNAFSIAPTALQSQPAMPAWTLIREELAIRCDSGRLEFDLGAIGKGFALDRMAQQLAEWGCPSFLIVAGGSSVLAGAAPPNTRGWSSGLGDDRADKRYWLEHCSLSGSGVAVKGNHILDPRTGKIAQQRFRAWAIASTAAESDALSTACMVLSEPEMIECLAGDPERIVLLIDDGEWRYFGDRQLPVEDVLEKLK